MHRPERRARFYCLQLLWIADQHDLGARLGSMRQHAFQLARADHARLVDHQDIARGEQVAALSPAMLHAGNGARRDTRSAFEIFRRDAGQRDTPDLIAGRFPSLSRHTQHGALSRSGMADHDPEIVPVRDMRQRVSLLAGKHKPASFSERQRRFAVRVTHLMALPFSHQFGGTMQALFGLDHLAGGEAILVSSVRAEFDEIWRATYRAHDLAKLVDPVAVPVRKLRHVAVCEGRLLLGDRVKCGGRIGDDPRTIAARDLAVHLGAVGGLDPFALDALCRRADLALRLQRDALCFKAAMVDASMSSSVRRSLAISAQAERHSMRVALPFQRRSFGPNPDGVIPRMVNKICACGLWPSPRMPKSAIMPLETNSCDTNSRTSATR
jgi:hypothetical protein